jgi:hypothetical protein
LEPQIPGFREVYRARRLLEEKILKAQKVSLRDRTVFLVGVIKQSSRMRDKGKLEAPC